FEIVLTDGSRVRVDIGAAATLQDVLDAITSASGRLAVGLDDSGTALVLADTGVGSGDVSVNALNGSMAAADLGILDTGVGAILEGSMITDVTGDLRVTLADGTQVDVDLSGATTVQDVLA